MKKLKELFKFNKHKESKKKVKKRKFRIRITRIKVKDILIASFLIIGIVPLTIVSYFTYQESKEVIGQKVGFYSQEIVSQVVDKIENKLEEIVQSSMLIIGDQELANLLDIEEFANHYERLLTFK